MKYSLYVLGIILSVLLINCGSRLPHTSDKAGLQEIYWKLTALGNNPVNIDTGNKREPHIMLRKEGNRVEGFAGCNGFGGKYELKGDNGITLSQLISTKMACPDLDTENAFMQALGKVNSYTITGHTLTLNDASGPLARFEKAKAN